MTKLNAAAWSMPPRYRVLVRVGALFVLFNGLVRLGLIAFEADAANLVPWRALPILVTGALYDLVVVSHLLIPFAICALVFPATERGCRAHAIAASLFVGLTLVATLVVAVAEGLFWNEFSARFNFIAVDYLVYTRETLGNILQSYPVGTLLAAICAFAAGALWLLRKFIWEAASDDGGTLPRRLATSLALVSLPCLSFYLIDETPREWLTTPAMRELAGNGYYEFARAFRNNELDYHSYYVTMPEREAVAEMRHEFQEAHSTAIFTGGNHPLERTVTATGTPRPMHIVLVTMESLGSDYVEAFGGKKGLTPNLDRLANDGLKFTQVYATGTRTVRGLEAISLSIPPTPGHAVLTRKHNKGFQTLGGVLKEQGYDPLFLYGGYSYFDNMKDFFGGNGYTVIDRTSRQRNEISHETIWGVADEDLFNMVVRELDARVGSGRQVFAHVMTTSNHRPFTYPAGRIDIPSGSGRDGAVKYSDWAIGKFMADASSRFWFKETLFVFVADHTSHARGRTDLPPENYRIPLIMYAPGALTPATITAVASQIDVGPTILAIVNLSYTSRFFGQDILSEGQHHQRAVMANYVTVGHMEDGILVELSPKRRARVFDAETGREISVHHPQARGWVEETAAHYRVATDVLKAK